MKRRYILGGIAAAAVLVGGGVGLDAAGPYGGGQGGSPYGASSSAAPGAMTPSIGSAALAPGTALVDGAGRTLYLFEADSPTSSACTGSCAQVWPPLLTHGGAPAASGPAQSAFLGTVQRADGTRQVTYNGHPLYFYVGDRHPGDAHGQGLDQFGAGWYVVTPAGAKIDSSG